MINFTATFYNGEDANAYQVSVSVEEGLQVTHEDFEFVWKFKDVFIERSGTSVLILQRIGDAYLVATEDVYALLKEVDKSMFRASMPRKSLRNLGFWVIGAISAVLIAIFLFVPMLAHFYADRISFEHEQKIGNQTRLKIMQFLEAGQCVDIDGQKALEKLVNKFPEEEGRILNVSVIDHDMINAFSLPGGYIIFMRGLIENAESVSEVAAILTHEIGHDLNRDATRLSFQTAVQGVALSTLLGDVGGSVALASIANAIMNSQYTLQAEKKADQIAVQMMNDAGLSLGGFIDFFTRMEREHEEVFDSPLLEPFRTHPRFSDRVEYANDHNLENPISALANEDWVKLQNICDEKNEVDRLIPEYIENFFEDVDAYIKDKLPSDEGSDT